MKYFLSESKPELSPKAAGPDTTCWLQVTVLTTAKGLQSAFLHPTVLHRVTRSPRTLIPASLSLPAAHVHHQWLMRMHQHSLGSDSVHGLLFGDKSSATAIPAVSCLFSSGSCSNNLKSNSPKQRTPNLESPLLVYGVQSQAGIPPILPKQ